MKKFYLLFHLCTFSYVAFSQHSQAAYQALADSLYKHHNYGEAAFYYQRAIKKSKHTGTIMLQVAKSYSKMNKIQESHTWFERARLNHAVFTNEDTYLYTEVLIKQKKRLEAQAALQKHLKEVPNDNYALELLDDLRNIKRYYKDSTAFHVVSLLINTPHAEFAPAYYKNGIVFSSAQPQGLMKRKYHWDDSHFLNLYHSPKINEIFQKPVLLDDELNTPFHDGPVAFYNGFENMILNRNQRLAVPGKKNTWIWHFALFDVAHNAEKKSWEFTPLPFDEPYSFAHPSITEDGNTLFFVSDRPGGYGGTDIYRVIRTNGVWGKPFNVGPVVNTPENEAFPFFNGSTLYFASDGHGGIGGLDIFKSEETVNGFAHPVNLGAPINSHHDDFSLITTEDQQSGYFASARSGNDDLFEFRKRPEVVKMIAHVFDGITKESMDGASVHLMQTEGADIHLVAGNGGNVRFELPREAAYMLIADKDGKMGMLSGFALQQEDEHHMIHPVALLGDTSRIACVATIRDNKGTAREAAAVVITDIATNKEIRYAEAQSLVSFLGEKGHTYRVEIANEEGDTTVQTVAIDPGEHAPKVWSMKLKETSGVMNMTARVFRASDGQPLAGAAVELITFAEPDRQLIADENGIIKFVAQKNAAYMVVATSGGLTGTHAGLAEAGMDKVVHPVPAVGDPLQPIPVVAIVAGENGEVLKEASVTVLDKISGEKISVKMENGVLSFLAENDHSYTIEVAHKEHESGFRDIRIPVSGSNVEKLSFVLKKKTNEIHMAARVFKESDNTPLGGAVVKVMSLTVADLELVANEDGIVEFSVPDGEAFILVGSKDGYTGMFADIAENRKDKDAIVHPIPANNDPHRQIPVSAIIMDDEGVLISQATVEVTSTKTGEKVAAKIENGILSFTGKGDTYKINLNADNYEPAETIVKIADSTTSEHPVRIRLHPISRKLPVTATITNNEGQPVNGAVVTVIDNVSGEKQEATVKDGLLSFQGVQGKQYNIRVEHQDLGSADEEVIIPQKASAVERLSIRLPERNTPSHHLMAARVFKESDNTPLSGATVKVMSIIEHDLDLTANEEGVIEFSLPDGASFIVIGSKDIYTGTLAGLAEKGSDKHSIIHPVPARKTPENSQTVVAFIAGENGKLLPGLEVVVTDSITGEKVDAVIENGIVSFNGKNGGVYKIEAKAQGYNAETRTVNVDPSTQFESLRLNLRPLEQHVLTHLMAARVFREEDNTPLSGATVKVMSIIGDDFDLTANEEGVIEFSLPDGASFIVVGSKDNYTGTLAGLAEKGSDKHNIIHPVPARKTPENSQTVVAFIAGENGKLLPGLEVVVTDSITGEKVDAVIENGIVSFNGKNGRVYKIEAKAQGYNAETRTVNVDPSTQFESLRLNLRPLEQHVLTHLMAARVFREEDNTPLSGATVKVMSIIGDDFDLTANEEGVIEFSLPDGASFIVVGSKDNYTGTLAGLAEKGSDKGSIIHPVPARKTPENSQTVVAFIADENGKLLPGLEVVVTDNTTGEKVDAVIENGIVSFNGKNGRVYKIEAKAQGYNAETGTVNVDPSTKFESLRLNLRPLEQPVLTHLMAARVFREGDNTPLSGATVKVMSIIGDDLDLSANEEGVIEFSLPDGASFIVIGSKDNYTGTLAGLAEKGSDKHSIIHPVPARKTPENSQVVVAFIADENGKLLPGLEVVVTDNTTGEKVDAVIENGILSFNGKNGRVYKIEAKAQGYNAEARTVNVDPSTNVEPLRLSLQPLLEPLTPIHLMAARVFKKEDNLPLAGAEVKIITITENDLEVTADMDGVVNFSLPDGTAYLVIATKDGYSGLHSGIAEKGMDKASVIHPVPAGNEHAAQLPVVILLSDENKHPLSYGQAVVTNSIGEKIEAKLENGILMFFAEKGGEYKIEVVSDDYETVVEDIAIGAYASEVEPMEVELRRRKLLALPPASKVIVLNNEVPRVYVTSDNSHDEITEKGGVLYLNSKEGAKVIGKGSIAKLKENPSQVLDVSEDQAVTLQNIYFDFNSAALDSTDKRELEKATTVLSRYTNLQLTVRAHADLRGSARYNLALTRKRARSIKTYLVSKGIRSRKILTRAFGKSAPAIVCDTRECTELQHQRNRRAEFALDVVKKAQVEPILLVKPQAPVAKGTAKIKVTSNYARLLEKYGDRQHPELTFKVCVGAYRLNPAMTFPELSHLGAVEKRLAGGINYYYLHDFATLKQAEDIRQQAIKHGIHDAYIAIFHGGKKINFSKFVSVTE